MERAPTPRIGVMASAAAAADAARARHPIAPGLDPELDALVERRAELHARLELARATAHVEDNRRQAIAAEMAIVSSLIRTRAAEIEATEASR